MSINFLTTNWPEKSKSCINKICIWWIVLSLVSFVDKSKDILKIFHWSFNNLSRFSTRWKFSCSFKHFASRTLLTNALVLSNITKLNWATKALTRVKSFQSQGTIPFAYSEWKLVSASIFAYVREDIFLVKWTHRYFFLLATYFYIKYKRFEKKKN